MYRVVCVAILAIFLASLFSSARFDVALGSRTIVVPTDFPTIQDAINNATDGDQIFVLNGTYYENVVVNKTIMLVGEDRSITTVDGDGGNFSFFVSSNNVSISGFTIHNSNADIVRVLDVENCILTGNTLANGSVGFHLLNTKGGSIVDNDISKTGVGIRLESCNDTLVENNNVTDNKNIGILVSRSMNIVAGSNLLARNINQGLFLNYSSGNDIRENRAVDNGVGLQLLYSNGNTVVDNRLTDNVKEGFTIHYSNGNNVSTNTVEYNGFGMRLRYSGKNTLKANNIASNGLNFGVEAEALSYLNDIDTSNKVNGKHIYYLVNRKDLVLTVDSDAGYIAIVNSSDITIRDLTLKNNNEGLLCAYSSRCTIENTTFDGNSMGAYISSSNYVNFRSNTINESSTIGVFISECYKTDIEDNTITKNGLGMSIYSITNSSIARNNVTSNLQRGVQMLTSNYNYISQNRLDKNGLDGIYMYNSHNNTLNENQVVGNMRDGIWVDTCRNNILVHNNASWNAGFGIYLLTTTTCQVNHNRIVGNKYVGLQLSVHADNNSIVGNYLSENVQYGINLYDCSYNRVINNNFLNRYQAKVFLSSSNSWDEGYPKGGNFWSDYTGTDLFWGPYQNNTGSDGTGDTPYIIDSNNKDQYPMMSQTRIHDVAVVFAAVSLDQPYLGWTVNINLTAKNVGDYVESFNVTIYCDDVKKTFRVDNLPIQESVTFTFVWNTTGSTPCSTYVVKCQADAVTEETNLEDNTYVAGNVHVKMMGDVDGNGTINILDIAPIATSFASRSGDARYRLGRDLNRDGVINILDISLAAQNFGKSCI